MMANKQQHLRELLKEDQEPFFLKDYIADRRSQLKRASPKTHLQVKRLRKQQPPPTKTTMTTMISVEQSPKQNNFPGKLFCRNPCFFSSSNCSPDPRKNSPLFEFPSPISKTPCKSPIRSNHPILLHIPARTAALLLEAALRIQKQSSNNNTPKNQIKSQGFGLLGSLLKRLTHRNRKSEIDQKASDHVKFGVAEEKPVVLVDETPSSSFLSSSCRCADRPSSAVWSESNEEKSSSSSSSTSHCGEDSEEIEFVTKLVMTRDGGRDDGSFGFCDGENVDDEFCDQIQSPFRFVLQRSPSSGRRTPDFSSPPASPCRHKQEDKEKYAAGSSKGFDETEEEEEKEQFSPVSVLDPPFEDDYDGHDDDDEDGFDLESSYAIVQRTKHQLLQKLRRFEKLAELDPIELEKRMLEQEEDDDDDNNYHLNNLEEEEECDDFESSASDIEAITLDGFVRGVLNKSSFHRVHRAPEHMKRLVSDLIVEECGEQQSHIEESEEEVVRRVCKRFESWKEVKANTIDMMVEQDFRKELEGWKNNKEQIGQTAVEIELAIFGLLVEELAEELVCCSGI